MTTISRFGLALVLLAITTDVAGDDAAAGVREECLLGSAFDSAAERRGLRGVFGVGAKYSPQILSKAVEQLSAVDCSTESGRGDYVNLAIDALHDVRQDIQWGAATALGSPPRTIGGPPTVNCPAALTLGRISRTRLGVESSS